MCTAQHYSLFLHPINWQAAAVSPCLAEGRVSAAAAPQ